MRTQLLAGLATAMTCAATAGAADRAPARVSAQPITLLMAMVGACAADDEIIANAQHEARRIWARANVTIEWVSPTRLSFASAAADWLVVRCTAAGRLPSNPDDPRVLPIAAIRFIGGLPTNTIVMSLENADALLAQDAAESRDPRGWAVPFRRVRLSRMLGRALAHEVGHFLTQSRTHTRSGLMRATHSVAALTGVSIGPFRVDPEQLAPVRIAQRGSPQPGS